MGNRRADLGLDYQARLVSHDPGDHWKPDVAEQAAIWRVLGVLVQDVARLAREMADVARRVTHLERDHPQHP